MVREPLGGAALVFEVAVAVEVALLVDPSEGSAGVRFQLADEGGVPAPALVLVEQDQEELGRVVGPVVGTVGVEAEADELPAPQLVQDLARLGVAEVVALRCLGLGQRPISW